MYIEINSDSQMEFQTDINPILRAINEYNQNYTWIISFHEFQYLNPDSYDTRLNANLDLIEISGIDLIEITTNSKIQFIWGVLSAFKGIPSFESSSKNKLNTGKYKYDPDLYLYPSAEIEIDCIDSTVTFVRSENISILENVLKFLNQK